LSVSCATTHFKISAHLQVLPTVQCCPLEVQGSSRACLILLCSAHDIPGVQYTNCLVTAAFYGNQISQRRSTVVAARGWTTALYS
jgi:hypothetical protein